MKFLMLGAGAWGCSMAVHLQRAGHTVTLVTRDDKERDYIRQNGESIRLPGVSLREFQVISPSQASGHFDAIFVGVPSHAFDEAVPQVKVSSPCWISLAKGIVLHTLKTPCEELDQLLPSGAQSWSLAGPTHAASVAQGLPCGMVLTGRGDKSILQDALSKGGLMRVYAADDRRGAELGGALKNAYAVAAGICDGLALGDNAKAGLLTRALAEMARLGVALGGQTETFFGLTGVGDLMATSYGYWSRNRQLGERVAKGEVAHAVVEGGLTAEGYRASKGLLALAEKAQVDVPILKEVVAILYHHKSPSQALMDLMTRPLKKE